MTTLLLITLAILTAIAGRTIARLIAQRDAERRRGDLALAEAARRERSMKRREQMLLDDLDFACSEAVALRERLENEALPVLQPWSGPPSLRVVADEPEHIFYSIDGMS